MAQMKEETLELDAIFSDFKNLAPFQNGSHLEFHRIFRHYSPYMLQTCSRCSALGTHRGPSEGSNERRDFGLWCYFLRLKKNGSVAKGRPSWISSSFKTLQPQTGFKLTCAAQLWKYRGPSEGSNERGDFWPWHHFLQFGLVAKRPPSPAYVFCWISKTR